MKTNLKTGNIQNGQSCANSVLKGATTMSINEKQLSKLLYYFAGFDGGVYMSGKNARFVMNMRRENKDYLS